MWIIFPITLVQSGCFHSQKGGAREQITNNYAVTVVWAPNQKGQEYFRPFCWSAEILWKNRKGKQSFPQAVCELSSAAFSLSLPQNNSSKQQSHYNNVQSYCKRKPVLLWPAPQLVWHESYSTKYTNTFMCANCPMGGHTDVDSPKKYASC